MSQAKDDRYPLFTVAIHNYNYGRYLRQCLKSVHGQDYPNVEVIFADNASTDDSWKIASGYARAHPGQVTLVRQKANRGSGYNSARCWDFISGKYFVMLCSDDALEPGFISKTVEALEANPSAGLAMVHRSIIDAEGNRTEELPFYNRSCLIPGEAQAGVYMMTSCTPSISQVVYNRARYISTGSPQKTFDLCKKWFGTRMNDFNICLEHDVVYLKDPLLLHRVHGASDSAGMIDNCVELIGQYLLPFHFAGLAEAYGIASVSERLTAASVKTSENCIRYAARAAKSGQKQTVERLLHLGQALGNLTQTRINQIMDLELAGKSRGSYDPPEGSIDL